MEGSSGAGSIYLEGFTLQIGKARVRCRQSTEGSTSSFSLSSTAAAVSLVSNQSTTYNVGDVLISGKCGNSIIFSVKDVAEPF